MNDTIRHILARRSYRQFNENVVLEDDFETILKCGIYAPTGRNKQNLFFIGLKDKEVVKKYKELFDKDIYYGARYIIVILKRFDDPLTELNVGAAMENMLIASEALGYQACWIHHSIDLNESSKKAKIKELFSLDKEYEILDSIAIGHSDNKTPAPLVRNTLHDKII